MPEIHPVDFFEHLWGGASEGIGAAAAAGHARQPAENSAQWVQHFRNKPPEGEAVLANRFMEFDCQHSNPLVRLGRECFSSACAMTAKFCCRSWTLTTINIAGSSTATAIHQLKSAAWRALACTDLCRWAAGEAQSPAGPRTPHTGGLFLGPVGAPRGGGHYACAIGHTEPSDLPGFLGGLRQWRLPKIGTGYGEAMATAGRTGPPGGAW